MFEKLIKKKPVSDENEYLQYAQEVEQSLSQLEAELHNTDDPQEIIQNMLIAATLFYDGDWAGIMEADLTMKIWSTQWWYNRRTNGMTPIGLLIWKKATICGGGSTHLRMVLLWSLRI